VVDALASFQESCRNYPKGHQHTVCILATPTFASWLEASSGFIPKALQSLFGPSNSVSVDVVCAVVDGLAPRPISMKDPSGEGFSILHKPRTLDHWAKDATVSSPTLQSTLTLQRRHATLTLPLANTLFKNGRHSTLLLSRWKSSGVSFSINRAQSEKQNVTLTGLGEKLYNPIRISIPSIPLTPVRRIQDGLGNIVRTIDFGQGDVKNIGPASQELEQSVTEYLAQEGHSSSTVNVWALIIPQDTSLARLASKMEAEGTLNTGVDVLRTETPFASINKRHYTGELIRRGALLCRVLSGGGGWGAKQGLLSLDPQTTYSTSNESRYDYSEGSPDRQQVSALGNLAQEGAFIQFLVAPKTFESLEENDEEHAKFARQSTVFGVVPSTVDDIPDEKQEKAEFDLQIHPGHFGCVSESGLFYRAPKMGRSNPRIVETKIDLPYSYAYL
jgi:hypothetical protein